MSNKPKKIERLVLSIATNQFKVPLPTGKKIVTAVNEHDALLAEVGRLRAALESIRRVAELGAKNSQPVENLARPVEILKTEVTNGR